ncbi:sensor histidine kinase [Actinomadura rupiterrae]|uniref:sensor histidine kinase n=1 Tax=Actinomadura rupiterrae TaxID=559627 RepID=UPI0020A50FD9|nr:HAMP domain-containing sensor histidine kinase [Actinomadura rupiterrae]MCP2336803.1 signal transduction histidine kinase [Actinomadura rupiterrae]
MSGPSARLWHRVLRDPSIRTGVTVRAVVFALLLVIPLYLVAMLLVTAEARHSLERRVARRARVVAELAREGRLPAHVPTSENSLAQVVDASGSVVAASDSMWGRPPVRFPAPEGLDTRRDGISCHATAPYGRCFQVVALRVHDGHRNLVVYGLERTRPWLPEPGVALLSALVFPLVALVVGAGAWRAAGRALRPVDAIRRDLDEITATDLERRVPEPSRKDEIHALARSINQTLDRLEKAVARQRAFISDLSHELRSPLTGLRTELELARSDPQGTDLGESTEAMLHNADRLEQVLNDLLALARLESDQGLRREVLDLHEIADQEVLRRPRRTKVTVTGDSPVLVRGGRLELARVLTNLIDNSDRHAASTVTVRVGEEGGQAVVEVVDDGGGIPPGDREDVFNRFTRLAESRHKDAGGTGLGLAISRDIVEAHGGSLVITDRIDGTHGARFVLTLPKGDPVDQPQKRNGHRPKPG